MPFERPRRLRRRKYRPRYRPFSDTPYSDYPTSERYYPVADSLNVHSGTYSEYDGASAKPEETESQVNLDSGRFKDQGFTVTTDDEPMVEEITSGLTETKIKFISNFSRIKTDEVPSTTTFEITTEKRPESTSPINYPSTSRIHALKPKLRTQGIPISITDLLKQKNLSISDVLKQNFPVKNSSEPLTMMESPKIDPVNMAGHSDAGSERRNRIHLAKTIGKSNKFTDITLEPSTSTSTDFISTTTRPTSKKYFTHKNSYSTSTMRITSPSTTTTTTEKNNEIELVSNTPPDPGHTITVSETENKIIIKPIEALKAAVMAAAGRPQNKIDTESPIHVQMAIPLEPQRKLAQLDVIESTSVKDELVDFLRTENGSARLARILASRNMTLRELIEHRERGSSQQHLADIFRSKPEDWTSEANLEDGIPSLSEMFNTTSSSSTTMRVTNSPSTTQKYIPTEKNTINNDEKHFLKTKEKNSANLEYLRQLENFERRFREQNGFTQGKISIPDLVHIEQLSTDEEGHRIFSVGEVEVVENNLEQLDSIEANQRSFQDSEDKPLERIPAAVKSAIIVSAAIFGLAILMFLAIFLTCRVRQRRARQRYVKEMKNSPTPNSIMKTSCRTRNTPIFVASTSYRKDRALVEDHDFVAPRRYYLWNTIRKTLRYK